MFGMKESAFIITISASIFLINCQFIKPYRSFEKELLLDNNEQLIFVDSSDQSNDFYYIEIDDKSNDYVFNVTVEVPIFEDIFLTKQCKLSFLNAHTKTEDPQNISYQLKPLDRKNVVVVVDVEVKSSVRSEIFAVQMENCKVAKISMRNLKHKPKVAPGNKNFDVLYIESSNSSNSNCRNNPCKVTYSFDGEFIRGPVKYIREVDLEVSEISSFLLHESSCTALIAGTKTKQPGNFGLYLVHDGTATKVLATDAGFSGWSVSNKKASFCVINHNHQAACRQYDLNANHLLNFQLNLSDFSEKPQELQLQTYNLRDGGMIVVMTETNEHDRKIENLKVLRIDQDNRYSLPLKIPKGEIDFSRHVNFNFMENDMEFCIKLISKFSLGDLYQDSVKYRLLCIRKAYFF